METQSDRFVAIVGMAGRFPGAPDIGAFWELIQSGREGISHFPEQELARAGVPARTLADPSFVPAHGVLTDVEMFDTGFFEMTPAEAEMVDPQHRLFLEVCHQALEDAGYSPDAFPGLIGVYGGASINTYLQNHVLPNVDQTGTARRFEVMVGNDKDYLATRVSYKLDLKGPAYTVQTACSTSLVAMHVACQALLNGECDLAIVGGATVKLPQVSGYLYEDSSILSADGHTRTFDADAAGVVLGNGVGAVVLKRLPEAVADRDTIHAVIRGTAINNDGARKVSFAAPARDGQAAAILEAQLVAGVDPETISYVEAHGTATRLGDPIELSALTKAFRRGTGRRQYCAIGSVKANIGHLDAAAGVTGVIKTALMLRNRMLVPAANFSRPNPAIPFAESPFFVNTTLRPWESDGPRRAGVSSFGIGGTNAHAILEEPPVRDPSGPSRAVILLPLSARTPTALSAMAGRLADHLRRHPDQDLADVAFTLALGRRAFAHRLLIRCASREEAIRMLEEAGAGCVVPAGPTVLSFRFQDGIDDPDSRTARLLSEEPAFTRRYQDCKAAGVPVDSPKGAAFAFQVALAELWRDSGLVPDMASGDGAGALAGAVVMGELSLEDAVAALAGQPPKTRRRRRAVPSGREIVLSPAAADVYDVLRTAWLDGARIDWSRYYAAERRARVPVPTYPFERRRCWLPPRTLITTDLIAAAGGGAGPGVREISVDIGAEALCADHVLAGAPIVPAAAFVDWALKTANRDGGTPPGQTVFPLLRDLTFEQALPFTGEGQRIRIVLTQEATGQNCEIRTEDGSDVLARGHLDRGGESDPGREDRIDIAAIGDRCPTSLSQGDAYDLVAATGLHYGPRLRVLDSFRCNGREALAYLAPPRTPSPGCDGAGLDPALLDGALQCAAVLLAHNAADAPADYLPYAISTIRLHRPLPDRCVCHVTITEGRSGGGLVKLDAILADSDGNPLVEVRGLAARARRGTVAPPRTTLLSPSWIAAEPVGDPAVATGSPILLLCDDPRRAEEAGAPGALIVVTPGPGFARPASDRFIVNPASRADVDRLFATLADQGRLPSTVFHCWCDALADTGAGNPAHLDLGVRSLLAIVRSLIDRHCHDRVRILFAHRHGAPGGAAALMAVAGLAHSLRVEVPDLRLKVVGVDAGASAIAALSREASGGSELLVRYQNGRRLLRRLAPLPPREGGAAWAPRGVQLITGGAGGIGRRLALHLVRSGAGPVIVSGRSELADPVAAELAAELAATGPVPVIHRCADVTDPEQVSALVSWIRAEYGPIKGVFHLAGVLRDSFLMTGTAADFDAVVAPKLLGADILDRCTADDPLDHFVLFSSIAAVFGREGQTGYAFANACLDSFAECRRSEVDAGRRRGRSLSIAWPLWRDGGMRQDEEARVLLEARTGLAPMPTDEALAALDAAMAWDGHVIAGYGDATRLLAAQHRADFHLLPPDPAPAASVAGTGPASRGDAAGPSAARDVAVRLLCQIFAAVTRMEVAEIAPDVALERYGIDSLVIAKLNRALDAHFPNLSKTLFFEYPTLGDIAGHLAAQYGDSPALAVSPPPVPSGDGAPLPATPIPAAPVPPAAAPATRVAVRTSGAAGPGATDEPIAIIGLAGRYPMANDLDAFWANLSQGRDCVVEVPKSRWNHDRYFDPEPGRPGRAYARWGGFLDRVDGFDPLFFGISPRAAELMDPQERLFLETAWHAMEDAGYRRDDLAQRPVGVFVGVMYGEYQLYSAAARDGRPVAGASFATIANRVSYVLNLTGPSLALDTMCSSSLSAIHLACESLRRGESEMAFAGGVNLSLHPYKYVFLSQGRYLATDGRCRAFGADGSGYVPGEGVGAVLLKPLAAAVADGDHIHGVIRGHAINHSGHTHGFTVPSPRAQADVLNRALAQAGLVPGDIDYIEAHGTGTALGDPIELSALGTAYGGDGSAATPWPVGSVKSNIGHLESAAGIAGLTKILLQFRHRALVPSLHCDPPNPNIDFARQPFRVQRALEPWTSRRGTGPETPLRAGLSSFGAGGANAHLILESYEALAQSGSVPARQDWPVPLAFVLSARDEAALRRYAGRLADALESRPARAVDVAHTLQIGREAFASRLAVIAREGAGLVDALRGFADGGAAPPVLRDPGAVPDDAALPGPLSQAVRSWLAGGQPDWTAVSAGWPGEDRPRRVPGPLYPFAEDRYWVSMDDGDGEAAPREVAAGAALHPLLDVNLSTLKEVRFRRTFRPDEPLVADHVIEGRRILAGALSLEMARVAAEQAGCAPPAGLADVTWLHPVELADGPRDVMVGLSMDADGVVFSLFTEDGGNRTIHARGRVAASGDGDQEAILDIAAIRARLGTMRGAAEVGLAYERAGFAYGPAFGVIEEVASGPAEALVRLRHDGPASGVLLPPAVLDGALRACHWAGRTEDAEIGRFAVPFAMGRLTVFAPLPADCYAYATRLPGDAGLFDVVIAGADGTVVARIERFAGRLLSRDQTLFYRPEWVEEALSEAPATAPGEVLLVIGDDGRRAERLRALGHWSRVIAVPVASRDGNTMPGAAGDRIAIDPADAGHYRNLFDRLRAAGARSVDVAHCLGLSEEPAGALPGDPSRGMEGRLGLGVMSVRALVEAARDTGPSLKVRCLVLHAPAADGPVPEFWATAGLALSTGPVVPGLSLATLMLDDAGEDRLAGIIAGELAGQSAGLDIRRTAAGRQVRRLIRVEGADGGVSPLMAGGVYLVTGARGGIGTPLSAHLAERYKAKLVLVGRSAVPDGDLARLRALGAEVMAIKADVTDLSQVRSAVDAAIRSFGRLDGVFHLAGVAEPPGAGLSDAPTFRRVLGPKLSGLIALDQATAALPLSLFVAFSSISSVVGDFGNGSYAAANRSVDVYMTRRARWVASGHRRGRSLSLAWPLWDGTGMNTLLTPSEIAASTARTGMRPLPVVQALLAMEQALGREESLLVPALGDAPAIDRALAGGGPDKTVVPAAPPAGTTETGQAEGVAVVRDHLLATVAGVLKIPAGQIDIRQPLSGYGLDSVLVMETIALLGKDFPGLRGTVLFEFPSIAELAAHIVAAHGPAVGRLAAGRSPAPPMVPVPPPLPAAKAAPAQAAKAAPAQVAKAAPAAVPAVIRDISGIPVTGPASSDAIAVIGMAGRYPDADTLDEFWDNLSRGRDSVGEVPPARWNAQALFDADPDAEGRSYGRWGAFLTDVDCFDSLFFQIAPAQAKLMDPQERLFLETAWAALEDAGYPPSRLPRPRFGNGGRDVGVFVGVMWDDYAILAADEARGGNHFLVLANRSGIANQLSYFCDFRGPSQVIDTACSSSLVALHQACESLRRGECAYAVAGGVNVAAHPLRYVHLSRKKMLSRDGRCRSFGDGGTGYVPGEGVGAVLLKPLSRALADGDHIRAVIRASAVNHGGRTTGYTVPNPHAQQAVIEEALDRARIDPRSLGYVEAHGTGTALGDPIEHTGLALAFARQTSDRGFCALGSVKSNIGHLEGAAGIVGVTKAILQLEHGRIVPSLHADTLNPLIDFVSSPFFVARQAQDWPRLADAPRRAAVSSFGAGGANAHVILEESPHGDRPRRSASLAGPRLIVLSAQGRNRLTAYAARLAAYLAGVGAGAGPDLDLADVAYSLQVGREAMPERLAFIAADIQDAARRLEAIGRGDGGDWLFVGTVRRVAAGDAEAPFPAPVVTGDLARLARLWTSGAEIDWDSLNIAGDDRGRRIPLPTYPFERVRHWLPVMAPPSVTAASSFVPPDSPSLGAAPPQPLPRDQTAERRLHHDRDDWVLRDHQVAGRRILPGAAHLDFVAGAFGVPAEIRDVAFLAPVVAGSDGITLSLVAGPDGDYRLEGPDGAVRSRGRRQDLIDSASATLSLDGVRLRCPAMTDGTAFYDGLSSFGLDYGPSFRCVETVWTGRDEALARLRLPGGAVGAHLLHPAVLDAALHTVAAIPGDVVRTRPALPFTIDRMTVFHPLPATAWVHALRRGPDSYDLSVAGDDGRVLLDLRGLCLREDRRDDRLPLYLPQWTPVPLPAGLTPALPDPKGVLVLAGTEDADLAARLLEAHSAAPGVPMLIGPDGLPDGAIAQALARVPSADLLYVLAVAAGAEAPRTLAGLRHHQERFLLSLIRLAQALDRAGILARPFHVKVVTAGLHPLHGQEEPRPWSAGLEGICAVLAKEYPRLRVASIDLRAVGGPGDRDPLFDPAAILAEPFQASLDRVSLRGGVRRLRRLARLDTPPVPTRFRKGGHYLVVGGFGVIGREVCLHLARSHGARLTILGRSPQESRGDAIAELTAAGADVLYERCDVTDPLSLEGALARARARFGVLHGVIHSAMTLVDRRVADLSRDDFTAAAAAKVDAVWSLFDAMRAEPLDFLVLFSSGASFDGNQGQAGYVAGNCFADAFARLAAREARFPVHVINWGYWQGDDADRRAFLSRLTEAGIRPIAPAEGIAALDRVLAAGPFQVLATPAAPRLLTGIGVEPDRILRPEGRAAPASGAVFAGKGSVPSVEPPEVALHLAAASRLEDWLAHGLFEVIGRLCVFDVAGARRSRSTLARELGIVPAMERQWAWMLSLLTADGVLAEDPVDGTLRVVRPPRDCDIGRLAAEHPTLGPTIAVLRRVLDALPDVLTGARDPIDVLLPGGSLELLSPLYSEDPVMACCNRQVATIVGDYVARRMADDAAAGVRILEIGAGAGATTATVLDALTGRMGALAGRAGTVHYSYTDVSTQFLRHGRRRFADRYPFVSFDIFDIERDPGQQGLEPGGFDLVLGSNVVHATRRVHHTLSQVKRLLRPNGLLVINEGTRVLRYFEAIFGLTSGWSSYEDPAYRLAGSPLLGAAAWLDVLADCGLRPFPVWRPSAGPAGQEVYQSVLVAESDGLMAVAAGQTAASTSSTAAARQEAAPARGGAGPSDPDPEIRRRVLRAFSGVLEIPEADLDPQAPFETYGIDSLVALDLTRRLSQDFGRLPVGMLFEHSSIEGLAAHLSATAAPARPDPVASGVPPSSRRFSGDQSAGDQSAGDTATGDPSLPIFPAMFRRADGVAVPDSWEGVVSGLSDAEVDRLFGYFAETLAATA